MTGNVYSAVELADMLVSSIKMRPNGNPNGWFRCPSSERWHALDLPGYLLETAESQASVVGAYNILRERLGGPIPNTRFFAASNLPSSFIFHVDRVYELSETFISFVSNRGLRTVPFQIKVVPSDRGIYDHYAKYPDIEVRYEV